MLSRVRFLPRRGHNEGLGSGPLGFTTGTLNAENIRKISPLKTTSGSLGVF